MKKHLSIVAAAALAVAGMGSTAQAQDAPPADNRNAAERAVDRTGDALNRAADATGDAAKSAADKTKDALREAGPGNNKEEIHDVLAQVAEAAATKDGLDDLVERFVDADRNRMGQNEKAIDENPDLDAKISQFRDDWKAKYTNEFDINDEEKVYDGFAMITEGEIGESARQAADKVEVDANANRTPDGGTASVRVDNNTGVDAPKANTDGQTAADRNLNDPGRNIATVTFPASHGMPEVKVKMIHEAGGWKIDVPDSVDAAKLRDNIQNVITKCGEMKDKWPTDANEAYRGFTHKVLLALSDKPLMDEAQKASETQPPSVQPAAPAPQ